MTEVQKQSVVYKYLQVLIFLANNRQVSMCTKHIDIRHHFMRDMVEDKDMDINYIRSKQNPADIMMNNFSDSDYVK